MGKLTSPILGFAWLGQYHVSHVPCFQAFSPAFSIEALMILEMGFLIKQDQMGRMLAQCMQRPGIVTWQRQQTRTFSEGDVSFHHLGNLYYIGYEWI